MKRVATCAAALAMCVSTTMAAAGGLNLNLSDCVTGGSVISTITNPCTDNTGSYALIGSCIVPTTVPLYVAGSFILDIHVQSVLSQWWNLQTGGCRTASVSTVLDGTSGGASCATIWDGLTSPAVANAKPLVFGPNLLRWITSSSGDLTAPTVLPAGPAELGVFKITILKTKSVGTGSCSGCTESACIMLQEVNLFSVDNVIVHITNPVTPYSNIMTYNSTGTLESCNASTPTTNRTWGAMKALYR